ncbi:hypothetical protein [Streptomyces sp. NPDC002889]|uniref:hypothetical protein n=1 Tax=Streptomyces sp. NPDC002889 TaxID=3364669 RepID=UPI0036800DB9
MSAPPGRPAAPSDGAAAGLQPCRTLLAVAGAGTLLVPAALAGRPGTEAAALAVALVLLAWHVLIARAGGTRGRGAAGLVADVYGPRAGRAVHACYFAGIACGQAAVAGAAGEFAADGRAAGAVAAGVLAVAAGSAAAGLLPGPRGRRLRLAAVLLLTAGWWTLPGLLSLDGRLPDGGAWGAAATLVVLFAWVGAEGDVPPLPRGRAGALVRLLRGPAVAASLLALLLAAPRPGPDAAPAAAAAGTAAALVLTAYCVTNLAACGARWSLLARREDAPGAARSSRTGVWAAAAIAAAVLSLARAFHLPAATLLLLPGAATAAILTLPAAAALHRRRVRAGTAPARPDPSRAGPRTADAPGRGTSW